MRYAYYLSVAGIKILFESDRTIVENEEFLPFVIEESTPDIHAIVRRADNMPKIPAEPLYADMFCAVAPNEAGHLQKFFFGSSNEQDHYVVSTCDPDNKHILIEYPRSPAYTQLTLSGCFYWLGFESYLLQKNKLCLHAACVQTHLGGILFSGKSGIGKSTQAELWCHHRNARQLNGDRPILSKAQNGWIAWGSPYAGSSKCYVNDSCPVTAIVMLQQAKTCSLRRLSPPEAFRAIWSGLTIRSWDSEFVETASLLVLDLLSQIPVFALSCTPDEQAVICLEQELGKEHLL